MVRRYRRGNAAVDPYPTCNSTEILIVLTAMRLAILQIFRHGERGTGNGERGTGNGEWGTGNGERGMGNGEWGIENTYFFDSCQ